MTVSVSLCLMGVLSQERALLRPVRRVSEQVVAKGGRGEESNRDERDSWARGQGTNRQGNLEKGEVQAREEKQGG